MILFGSRGIVGGFSTNSFVKNGGHYFIVCNDTVLCTSCRSPAVELGLVTSWRFGKTSPVHQSISLNTMKRVGSRVSFYEFGKQSVFPTREHIACVESKT